MLSFVSGEAGCAGLLTNGVRRDDDPGVDGNPTHGGTHDGSILEAGQRLV